MPVIIPPGFAQVTHNFESAVFESGVGAVVYGISGFDDVTPGDAIGSLNLEFGTLIVQHMNNQIRMSGTTVITSENRYELSEPYVGGNNFPMPPPNVATLVRKVTSGRGRRAQGRMFLPGLVSETDIDNAGFIDPTARATLQGRLDDWLDALLAPGFQMAILHGSEGETPAGPPNIVTGLALQPKVASQRRRLR